MFLNLFLPAIGVMLAFIPWFSLPSPPGWCLARTVVASLVGIIRQFSIVSGRAR